MSMPNAMSIHEPQQPPMSIPNERLIRKERVLNMFINESVKQLLGVFGVSVYKLSLWFLDRSKALSHCCGRCGRRAAKYCQIATVVGHTHRYRICRKCCGCGYGSKDYMVRLP
ncbi:hypothetical protein DdX_14838 [Ditylenchus destructor]|uniref:Uncharacterized protein n=1 Tax=Ditylenchus destructor TaxID=166010 RepID=A0AAD4MTX1_9BILA|nr:hypothetical protein DdX_14838 [Ditylenchus destructor]